MLAFLTKGTIHEVTRAEHENPLLPQSTFESKPLSETDRLVDFSLPEIPFLLKRLKRPQFWEILSWSSNTIRSQPTNFNRTKRKTQRSKSLGRFLCQKAISSSQSIPKQSHSLRT